MNHSRTQPKLNICSNTEPSSTDLTSFYKGDKRIINFLQKNELAEHRRAQEEIRTQSHSLLTKINSLFNLKRDTSFQRIKQDNSKFINDFKKAKNKNHLKPPKEVFKHIIKEYNRKGYKIPNLSLNNNLFDINPLSEKCKDKIENTFIFTDTKHRQSLKKKTLKYLRKIRLMVHEQIQYYKKEKTEFAHVNNINKHHSCTFISDSSPHEARNESIPVLLNQIAKLIEMINECLSDSNEYLYMNRNPHKRVSSNSSGFKVNSKDGKLNSLFSPTKSSEFIKFKINTSLKPKQNKNKFNALNCKMHQLRQNAFDFMNLRIPTNRSEIDCDHNSPETSNTFQFFLRSPVLQSRSKQPSHKTSSVTSVCPSPSLTKLRPSVLDISHSKSRTSTRKSNGNTTGNRQLANSNVRSFWSMSNSFNSFNVSDSTNFNTFKNGFGLGLSIRNKYKKQFDLISFAYDKCREKDFITVKTALRILLEKYKQMYRQQ